MDRLLTIEGNHTLTLPFISMIVIAIFFDGKFEIYIHEIIQKYYLFLFCFSFNICYINMS